MYRIGNTDTILGPARTNVVTAWWPTTYATIWATRQNTARR